MLRHFFIKELYAGRNVLLQVSKAVKRIFGKPDRKQIANGHIAKLLLTGHIIYVHTQSLFKSVGKQQI